MPVQESERRFPDDELVVVDNVALLLAHLAAGAHLDDQPAPSVPTLGLSELRHDLEKELAVLRLLLERLSVSREDDDVEAAQRQAAVLHTVLRSATRAPVQERVDVSEIAGDVAAGVSAVHAGRIVFRTTGRAVVTGDPALIRRAVVNLVDNARAAAPEGVVRLQVHGTPAATSVEVEDDGSAATVPHGSGLGLQIVRSVAELHGGAASTDSSPLGGRRVLLVLPSAGAA